MDGESTQRLLNEMFDVECSIDEAIEIEQHLFSNLSNKLKILNNILILIEDEQDSETFEIRGEKLDTISRLIRGLC